MGYAFESFEPEECELTSTEPGSVAGSCAGFDRLFGHRLAVANLEMRVPVLGTPQFGLLNFPFLPTEFVLFADAGLAWNSLDEVDFDFVRSGGKRVPVFSAGASARFNIFGFLILEAYYAYPFQRPDKGSALGLPALTRLVVAAGSTLSATWQWARAPVGSPALSLSMPQHSLVRILTT